mmetsp:Transcript_13823/g.22224  ORF Transcript_13823/g.22224 Transcript_13823/m.22224 type:complete len:148 (-) Transcript_13823:1743-2186(-)
MKQMMIKKGFQLKPEEEIAQIREKYEQEFEREAELARRRRERMEKRAELAKERRQNGPGDSARPKLTTVEEEIKKIRENSSTNAPVLDKANNRVKGHVAGDEDIDVLPHEDTLSKEQIRELKMAKWKEATARKEALQRQSEMVGAEL